MYYIVETDKSVDRATADLEAAVQRHGFGILHVHNLKQTLANKGFALPAECRVYEICQPAQALKVLTADMNLNMALPCRVSVYEQNGRTRIGTIRPTEMLGLLSEDATLAAVAKEVDATIEAIIDEAAAT